MSTLLKEKSTRRVSKSKPFTSKHMSEWFVDNYKKDGAVFLARIGLTYKHGNPVVRPI